MSARRDNKNGSLVGRIMLAVAGVGLVGFGVLFLKSGVWMYKTFNFRFGTPSTAFPAAWIGLGILFFLLGALPWANWLERRNRR